MSRLNKKGLVFALENAGEEALPPVEGEETNTEDLMASQMEADEVGSEVENDVEEVEEMNEALEEAEADIDTLETIRDTMEDSLEGESEGEEGEGMSETAAEIAEVAIEHIYNKLGYQKEDRVLPALESFGSTNSRREATKQAVIALEADIGALKKKLVDWAEMIMRKIREFWMKFTQNNDKLLAHINEQSKAVAPLKKDTKAQYPDYLDNASLAKKLQTEETGDVDLATIRKTAKEMKNVLSKGKDLSGLLDVISTNIKDIKDDVAEIPQNVLDYANKVKDLFFTIAEDSVLYAAIMTPVAAVGRPVIQLGFKLVKKAKEFNKEVKIKCLKPTEMEMALNEARGICNSIKEYRDSLKNTDSIFKKIKEAMATESEVKQKSAKALAALTQNVIFDVSSVPFQQAFYISKYVAASMAAKENAQATGE